MRLLRIAYALTSAGLVTGALIAIGKVLHRIGSSKTTDEIALDLVAGKLGLVGKLASDPASGKAFASATLQISFATLFFLALWKGRGPAERIYENWFAEFNTDLMHPARDAQSLDPLHGSTEHPPLAWIRPSHHRLKVWEELLSIVTDGVGDGRSSKVFASGKFVPFRWSLVLGRSGSGKSRTVLELALKLSRDERSAMRACVGWLRRHFWFTVLAKDDPWDVGFITRREGVASIVALSQKLRAWRPRKPTLLIVDDPEPGWAEGAISTLDTISESFGHAVRLLVVNQTVPAGLFPRGGLSAQCGRGDEWLIAGANEPQITSQAP